MIRSAYMTTNFNMYNVYLYNLSFDTPFIQNRTQTQTQVFLQPVIVLTQSTDQDQANKKKNENKKALQSSHICDPHAPNVASGQHFSPALPTTPTPSMTRPLNTHSLPQSCGKRRPPWRRGGSAKRDGDDDEGSPS